MQRSQGSEMLDSDKYSVRRPVWKNSSKRRSKESTADVEMWNNSSSSFNDRPTLHSTDNSSSTSLTLTCRGSTATTVIYSIYTLISILLIPLFILILYMLFNRWKRRRSAPGGATMKHSDVFTLHMMILEIVGVFGSLFYSLDANIKSDYLFILGSILLNIILPGQSLFHVLACLERYVAVVHAIKYMQLREKSAVRIRNILIALVWLGCFSWMGMSWMYVSYISARFLIFSVTCLCVILFFCLSALHVLTRPRPGEAGRHNRLADQAKQKAFHMIVAITGVLMMRSVGLVICFGIEQMLVVDKEELCMLVDLGIFLTVPSSLVLPLLFLHREGKLTCQRNNSKSG